MKVKTMLFGIILALSVDVSFAQIREVEKQGKLMIPTEWITKSLKEMQKVKIGMTRADLLKVFTIEGGLSTGVRRTYVYRECPYIKVDVEFDTDGRPALDSEGHTTLAEADEDRIKQISKPYLDWSIID